MFVWTGGVEALWPVFQFCYPDTAGLNPSWVRKDIWCKTIAKFLTLVHSLEATPEERSFWTQKQQQCLFRLLLIQFELLKKLHIRVLQNINLRVCYRDTRRKKPLCFSSVLILVKK